MDASKKWNDTFEESKTVKTEGQEGLSRYTPQHPLPEEIKKLARDDTVCKYCGVSYLIHNEIKALEDKLKAAEKELALLRGQEAREEALKRQIDVLKQQTEGFKTSNQANNSLISSLNSEVSVMKEKVKELTDSCNKYKSMYMASLKKLSSLTQTFRQQRQSLTEMRQHVQDQQSEAMNSFKSALEHVVLIKDKHRKETQELESKVQCTDMEKLVLTESNKTLTDSIKQKDAQIEGKNAELRKKQEDLDYLKTTLEELEKNLSDADKVSNSYKAAQTSLEELKKQLEEKDIKCKSLSVELEQYKIQLRSKNESLNDLLNKQKQKEQSNEVAMQKIQLELKNKEGELVVVMKQLKTWENKWREQQRKEDEILQQTKQSKNETQDMKDILRQTKADVEALKAEREMMIAAHQNRIEDLRESFKNKMGEMENWPLKLQAAVAAEKTRHLAEVKKLEENLKHNFVLELQIEKDKYNELLKKFQNQEKDKDSIRNSELLVIEKKYKQELEQLQKQLKETKNQAQEREADLQAEINSLKKIIKDLQDRFARLDGEDDGKVASLQNQLANSQQQLSDTQSELQSLDGKFKEVSEQAQFLQKIVQKECEERFELTEALSEARKELLHLKKPPGGYIGSKRGSVSSVHSNNSHNSPAPPPAAPQSQTLGPLAPTEDPMLKLRNQMPTSNIKLSYSNRDRTTPRNNSGGSLASDRSTDSKILESRQRIANMMGRR